MKTQPLKEHQAIYSVMVGFLKSLLEISLVLCTRNQISEMYKSDGQRKIIWEEFMGASVRVAVK